MRWATRAVLCTATVVGMSFAGSGAGAATTASLASCRTSVSGATGQATCYRGLYEVPYSYRALVRCSTGTTAVGNWAPASTPLTFVQSSRATCQWGTAVSVRVEIKYGL